MQPATTPDTVTFHGHLLAVSRPVWQKMLDHPFLAAVADGSIADDVFKTWLAQDFLFVQAAIPFMGVLLAKAPAHMRPVLGNAIVGLTTELDLFRQQAKAHNADLTTEMAPTCHGYVQFLLASAYDRPLETSFAILYGAEKAYLDSWDRVKELQRTASPWQAFIDNWTSDGFRGYVDWLATSLDELAASQSAAALSEMEEHFVLTARYEYLFWDMAMARQAWPV